MTEHLYYHDSLLLEFDAEVLDLGTLGSHPALALDRTAFYPTSGGQTFDTGWVVSASDPNKKMRVIEVAEKDDGTILHAVESMGAISQGSRVRGLIDSDRRRDHMQQHSGQHVLSAAFVRLFQVPTVSFHMGADACSIDLDAASLTNEQVRAAEVMANDVVMQDRSVAVRFVTREEAQGLGLRKLPPGEREQLRLIDIADFDLTACGGTHVSATGQIGCILLRKVEKVRQGWRVEFVCGQRAVTTARHDYTGLVESAGLLSSHIWDVPGQIRKSQEETRTLHKSQERLLGEVAELHASLTLAETSEHQGRKVVVRIFPDRDLTFIKLLAQKITRQNPAVIALLANKSTPPALVFAQSAGQPFDMGVLMKEALSTIGGRGGGTKDMAQGGPIQVDRIDAVLPELAAKLQSHS